LTSQRNYAYKSAALGSAPKTRPKWRVFAFLGFMAPARQQPSLMPKPQPVIRGRQIRRMSVFAASSEGEKSDVGVHQP
jgi:hypothetical protein